MKEMILGVFAGIGVGALFGGWVVYRRERVRASRVSPDRSEFSFASGDSQSTTPNKNQWIDYAKLLNSTHDAVIVLDAQSRVLFANRRLRELFAVEAREEMKLWEIVRDPDVLGLFKEALTGQKSLKPKLFEHEYGRDSQRMVAHLSLSISPVTPEGSRGPLGVIGFFHDVTELKRAEQMRIDFVANVSHELRTPLTAIKGFTETLLSDIESGRAVTSRFLQVIDRNADRLMSLVVDLLDLSTLESSREELERSEVSIRGLTQKVKDVLMTKAQAKGIKIREEFGVDLLWAHPQRLEQVLTNLMDNAVKYSEENSELLVRWASSEGGVILEVCDQGQGISAEHLPRLFERFYRVDKARSRDTGGTGLGLAIVKHTVERHGGRVWVESQVGRGSRFYCWFPQGASQN